MKKLSQEETEDVTYEQFASFVRQRDLELRASFEKLDMHHSGSLDAEDICAALREAGFDPSPEVVRNTMARLDANADGRIDYGEFRKLTILSPSLNTRAWFEQWKVGPVDYGEPSYTVPEKEVAFPWASIVLAGGLAGSVSRTATAPFDRLKTLLQAGSTIQGRKVTGIRSGLLAIYRDGGAKAFFRGNGVNVLKITPESATRWFAFEQAMNAIAGPSKKQREAATPLQRFVAGALAGLAAQTAVYPLEVTKTRLAVAPTGTYSGMVDCLRSTVRGEGFAALFRGLTPSLLGIVPYAGVDMSVYFTLKSQWLKRNPDKEHPSTLTILTMGATSSICGQTIAYPLQLVRTRLQTVGSPGYSGPAYSGMTDCFASVLKSDGFFGLYRGIGSNFLKAVPAISLSYGVYENVKHFLGIT